MKNSAMLWVKITSIMLLLVTLMAAVNFPFNWVFYATVLGQAAFVYMVYSVLSDNYSTKKAFEDFYEDSPVEKYR